MQQIQVHNPHFLTYQTELFTLDVLGGVDLAQLDRMIATLRITYQQYPPFRTSLDLYNDTQTEKLTRTLCDKWGLKLIEVSKAVHAFILELESYRLNQLQYPSGDGRQSAAFDMNETESVAADAYLKDKHLIENLKADFHKIGILGEDENALILFLAMASHRSENPFSVLCLAKSGIGKSYLLQKLAACMPQGAYSYHTQISENALYYFDSRQLNRKVLFIEDLDFTHEMLTPLATLQTSGRLTKTRATKNKDGLLHSTTFEVAAKLCMIACAYSEVNYERLSLPFLCLHLNHSQQQDSLIMDYQRAMIAGQIDREMIAQTQSKLQCIIASLELVQVINPYAPFIQLPENMPHPRKSLMLLLDFINVITFFHQAQRAKVADQQTGEMYIQTTPEDIGLAFSLLKGSLLRKADELSTTARGFYNWLQKFLSEGSEPPRAIKTFTALDIRKARSVHPRTLNRYLYELSYFHYIQIAGGNKYRGGFIYKLTNLNELATLQTGIEASLKNTLEAIADQPSGEPPRAINENSEKEIAANKEVEPEPENNPPEGGQLRTDKPDFFNKAYKRIRINDKEEHTYKFLLELEAAQPGREYQPADLTAVTKRNIITEGRYVKTLWEQGKLNREWRDRQYFYTLVTAHNCPPELPASEPVSQNPLSNS